MNDQDLKRVGKAERALFERMVKHKTNYDRLIRKTPEELAEWIINIEPAACPYATQGYNDDCNKTDCCQCWIDWLREAEE